MSELRGLPSADTLEIIFGKGDDPIHEIERRAIDAFPHQRVVIWQADPQTFSFEFVGGDVISILGYPPEDWYKDDFWVSTIVHPDDRDDAIAFCALATGKRQDHAFLYRAVDKQGRLVWFWDFVRVILGARMLPVLLRGLMLDVTTQILTSNDEYKTFHGYSPAGAGENGSSDS